MFILIYFFPFFRLYNLIVFIISLIFLTIFELLLQGKIILISN